MAKNSLFDLSITESGDSFLDEVISEESEFDSAEWKPDYQPDPKNSAATPKGDGIELSDSEYNDALDALQKAVKQTQDMMESTNSLIASLKNARINPNLSSPQEEYAENAILAAYENGPYYEASDDPDKGQCKECTKKLRNDILKEARKDKIDVMKVAILAKGDVAEGDELWKVAGIIIAGKEAAEGFAKVLEERLSKKLDGCKLKAVKASKAQLEAINKKRKTPADEAYLLKTSKK